MKNVKKSKSTSSAKPEQTSEDRKARIEALRLASGSPLSEVSSAERVESARLYYNFILGKSAAPKVQTTDTAEKPAA